MIGIVLMLVAAVIVIIWVMVEFQRLKHKIFAIVLISLILFGYLSFALVLKDKNLDYRSVAGLMTAGKVYFSWLGGTLGNFKTMTSHAISLDWYPEDVPANTDKEK
jgi:hypothetical protein